MAAAVRMGVGRGGDGGGGGGGRGGGGGGGGGGGENGEGGVLGGEMSWVDSMLTRHAWYETLWEHRRWLVVTLAGLEGRREKVELAEEVMNEQLTRATEAVAAVESSASLRDASSEQQVAAGRLVKRHLAWVTAALRGRE